jgi:hypothetical protein
VTIRGRFIGDAPYVAVRLRSAHARGLVWFLADTGASRTVLLDYDAKNLGLSAADMELTSSFVAGIGGSVRSFCLRAATLVFAADGGDLVWHQDLLAVQHDLTQLPPEEVARILKLPSLLGRDFLNRFRFTCDSRTGFVELER